MMRPATWQQISAQPFRFAGGDGATNAAAATTAAAIAAANLYGLWDGLTGETHFFNSGEFGANMALSALPIGTGVLGALAARQASPELGMMHGAGPRTQAQNDARLASYLAKAPGREGMSPDELRKLIARRGGRHAAIGTAAGALLGAIPAVLAMRDGPAYASPEQGVVR